MYAGKPLVDKYLHDMRQVDASYVPSVACNIHAFNGYKRIECKQLYTRIVACNYTRVLCMIYEQYASIRLHACHMRRRIHA